MMIEKFLQASRAKARFNSPQGSLTVEDLWDLPLTSDKGRANLDDIAKDLHKQLKNGDDVSFVTGAGKSDEAVQLKFDIVKYVIDTKIGENAIAAKARANKEKKQQLLAIIAQKESESLMGASLDELKAMVDTL